MQEFPPLKNSKTVIFVKKHKKRRPLFEMNGRKI